MDLQLSTSDQNQIFHLPLELISSSCIASSSCCSSGSALKRFMGTCGVETEIGLNSSLIVTFNVVNTVAVEHYSLQHPLPEFSWSVMMGFGRLVLKVISMAEHLVSI